MFSLSDYTGEAAAMTAAMFWSISTIAYGRAGRTIPPLMLNMVKGLLGAAMMALALVAMRDFLITDDFARDGKWIILLIASGAIGIGIGDSAHFQALNDLGARRTLLIETAAPPMTALLAWIVIGEALASPAWLGMFLILIGISCVITERTTENGKPHPHMVRGVLFALLASTSQAVGAVMSRIVFNASDISPLWTALIRILAGVVLLAALIPLVRRVFHNPGSQMTYAQVGRQAIRLWPLILLGTFLGTFLGIWLQQIAFKFAKTGIAQTLLALSPIFVLPMVALAGERVHLRAILGAILAVAGVALLFLEV